MRTRILCRAALHAMTVPAAWRARSRGKWGSFLVSADRASLPTRAVSAPRWCRCTTMVQRPLATGAAYDYAPRSAYTAFVTRRILIVDDERRIVDMLTEF